MSSPTHWSETNRLAQQSSPYLRQHADNPVHWVPWSQKVFQEARRRDLPLLVSIGYSTCHWCHVMAHESFEDNSVAKVMNLSQINVKVDREEHPGVDAIYMEAAQTLTGSGGWPLNVFINHEGRPFLAVTYLPPLPWVNLVKEVNHIWKNDKERIETVAEKLSIHLKEKRITKDVNPALWSQNFLHHSKQTFDALHPGFAPGERGMKFPPSQALDWLLEHGEKEGFSMTIEILTAMMDSGLHDRVAGGFHRYSVDSQWRVPHFEKMTYDNAQLMGLYARAANLAGSSSLGDDLLDTARRTADWFIREMRVKDEKGCFVGYATATDADDPLGEGSYFAWPPSELTAVLGEEDAAWLAQRWNITGDGCLPLAGDSEKFEPVTSWIPHPRGAQGYPEIYRTNSEDQAGPSSSSDREAALIEKLKAARSKRPAPRRDDKVLTDQNSLILEGFSRLARYGGGDEYHQAAVELGDLLIARFNLTGKEPRIARGINIEAYVTDYGYLAMSLTAVYCLTGNPNYISAAESTAEEAVDRLATGAGDYYSTPKEDRTLYKRSIEAFDGPSPAGQYALGIAFGRLYTITGRPVWKERADALLQARAALASGAPSGVPSLIRLASIRRAPYTLVVAGPRDSADTQAILKEVKLSTGPDFMVVAADQAAADSHVEWGELEGRIGLEASQLLICQEGRCLLPAFSVEEVRERLADIQSHPSPGAQPSQYTGDFGASERNRYRSR